MKIVKIEWVDSNIMHGWQPLDIFEGRLALCESVGYLYEETDELVTLTMGASDLGSIIETLSIPRGCIKSIKELRVR